MSQNKSASSAANKDLSCLRCRKKKAKCSKTRPACTRCARSNQPCEYPDAPPNLTDLSQKVLGLYDTLRELEDKFMLQYTAQEQDELARVGDKRRRRSSSGCSNPKSPEDMPSIETLTLLNTAKRSRQTHEAFEQQNTLPGNWSMSLTSDGLSLHAVARNMIEFSTFAKDFSHQLRENDPESKLTKSWEWYEEEVVDDDEEPLDENEYLVTVPVYSLPSLLGLNSANSKMSLITDKDDYGDDTLSNRLQPIYQDIMDHLRRTYSELEANDYSIHRFHVAILMQQLEPFVPFDQEISVIRPIQLVCTATAYAASIVLLNRPPPPSHTVQLADECITQAMSMLIELVFQRQYANPLPMVMSAALLAWMGKFDMAHLATRVLCGCDDWDENSQGWQLLAASLLYFEVYSMAFSQSGGRHDIGEAETWLLRSAKRLTQQTPTYQTSYYASGLGLETELVCMLKRVFALFYDKGTNQASNRKIDVDDVLKLVQNIEEWEHHLPPWAQWTHDDSDSKRSTLKTHIHLIHNAVKILLFRPFSIEPFGHHAGREENGEELQTHTRTTFLDLSMAAADRLTVCIRRLHDHDDDEWVRASYHLARDVIRRVEEAFPCDDEVLFSVREIETRLKGIDSL